MYLFFATMSGTISSALCGASADWFDTGNHPERNGYILCGFVFFSYLGSIPFFYLAGLEYKKFMINKYKELEQSNGDFR
jgi:hypothetical protein